MRGKNDSGRAFTMVELLAVMFLIAAIIGIVVGVARHVRAMPAKEHTRVRMQVIMTAVDAFFEIGGAYPAEPPAGSPPGGWLQRDWDAVKRGSQLLSQLRANPAGRARLAALDKDAIKPFSGGGTAFADGFGKYMDYLADKGRGGRPLLLSAGPDSNFDTTRDNIRSDD